MQLYYSSIYTQWFGSFLIAISCLPQFNRREPIIKALGIYGLGSFLFQLAQLISIYWFKNAGVMVIGDTFVPFEFVCFSTLFYIALKKDYFGRLPVYAAILYLVFYAAIMIISYQHAFSLIRVSRDFILILYAVFYFRYLIRELPEENLLKVPMFWINAIVLFYFSGTFILSLMMNYLVEVLNNNMIVFWTFRNFFRFLFCLPLVYAAYLEWNMRPSHLNSMNDDG